MSVDRRLRVASHELREIEVPIPARVPRPVLTKAPALALPILMVVFGAALAVAGVDRTPQAEPVAETTIIAPVEQAPRVAADPVTSTAATADASYDLQHELRLIRHVRSSAAPARGVAAPPSDADGRGAVGLGRDVPATDLRAELELIDALVERGPVVDTSPDATGPERPIVGLI